MNHRRAARLLLPALLLVPIAAISCRDRPAEGKVPGAPVTSPRQVRSYPHDPDAFTQGLDFHQGDLLESTGRYGESSLRRVRLETGEVVQRVDLDRRYFAEGLAELNGRIYQLTWQDGLAFVYDAASFAAVDTLEYAGEGWGLTTDGTSMILSDGSDQLRFLDPGTFAVQRVVQVTDGGEPVHQLNELEWVRGEVWANVWHDRRIARIDPQSGRVREWLDLSQVYPEAETVDPEAVPNGIAWEDATGRLFVTGKLWPRVYEISVADLQASGAAPVGAETPDSAAP